MYYTLFCTEIDGLHYARHLLPKMLEDDPKKRISSLEVVNELKLVKIKVTGKEENCIVKIYVFIFINIQL